MRTTTLLPLALCALFLASPALAQSQKRHERGEGILIRLEPTWSLWSLDPEGIQSQTNLPDGEVQAMLVDHTPDQAGIAFSLGYNIEGHATVALTLGGTGWDLDNQRRGGAGFGGLELSWHPLQLSPALRDRRVDVSLFGGAGYFLFGEHRALDGLQLQGGGRAEYFVSDWFSVGASVRYISLRGARYVLDWDSGEEIQLKEAVGGSLILPALTLSVHAPVG